MEYVDLYRNEFEKLPYTAERNQALRPGEYSRIVFVCIFNPEGKLLIQQRSLEKRGWPGLWDVSASGAVQAGESCEEAVCREVFEELSLVLEEAQLTRTLSLYYENRIHDFFAVVCEKIRLEDLKLQEGEVSCVKWASEDEIEEMIDEGTFVRVYKEFIGLLFRMKNRKGILM